MEGRAPSCPIQEWGTEVIPQIFLWEIFAIMRKIPVDVSALRIPS